MWRTITRFSRRKMFFLYQLGKKIFLVGPSAGESDRYVDEMMDEQLHEWVDMWVDESWMDGWVKVVGIGAGGSAVGGDLAH